MEITESIKGYNFKVYIFVFALIASDPPSRSRVMTGTPRPAGRGVLNMRWKSFIKALIPRPP